MKKIFLALLIVVFSLIATGFLGESVRGASNNINNGINFSSQAVSDNLCGNGIVEGNESCDSGANTGNICTPEYNNYCVYCTKSCEFEKIEGPICGDNIVNGPEECDDGNYVNGDGCSSICKIEGQAPYCGDGLVNGNESCDSGFNNGNVCVPDYNNSCTYCSNDCKFVNIEGGFCGDNIVNGNEACDDGNHINGDGCDSTCNFEIKCYNNSQCGTDYDSELFCSQDSVAKNRTSYTCNYPGQANSYCSSTVTPIEIEQCSYMCTAGQCVRPQPYCGDGHLDSGEQCDDHNNVNGDGCNSQCLIESPAPICGNNIKETGEQCDQGSSNGQVCDNSDSSCQYCTNSCQVKLPITASCGASNDV